jgi:hypothetical protein
MAGEIDTTHVITELLPSLHADSADNLTFWTKSDLILWMDDGLKRMARVAGCFLERDLSITASAGRATYPLPQRHDATLHVSFGSSPLRPASMIELEARNADFQTAAGTPDHWYEDGQGQNIGLAPVPSSAGTLPMVISAWPPALDAAQVNTLVQAPAPFAGYLAFYALAKAYGREGEAEMPDVAAHCEERCRMWEQVFERYYGRGM